MWFGCLRYAKAGICVCKDVSYVSLIKTAPCVLCTETHIFLASSLDCDGHLWLSTQGRPSFSLTGPEVMRSLNLVQLPATVPM